MTEIRHIEGEVGPEILGTIGTGLIFNHASWSGPSRSLMDLVLKAAPEAGIPRVFVIDHDSADRFVRLFDKDGSTQCHGWGDLIYVSEGMVKKTCHKFSSMNEVIPWLHSIVSL